MNVADITINQAVLDEIAAEDAEFGYKSSPAEVANSYWSRGLTGDQRISLASRFTGSDLVKVRRSVSVLMGLIESHNATR